MVRNRAGEGKTANFYFSNKDWFKFHELQQRLGYEHSKSAAMRAILELADIVVEKMEEGYVVRLVKSGADTLRIQL